MNAKSQTITVDGLNIRFLTAGEALTREDGAPVVLLHGAGVDSAELSWGLTIEALAHNRRVIAPDLPGYGQSDKPDVHYTIEFYLDFLEHFLNALGLRRVCLVGLSMGGAIALGFTLRHPEQVEKLVPVDPYGIMDRMAWHRTSYLYVASPFNELSYWFFKRSKPMLRWSLASGLISDPARITPELLEAVLRAAQDPSAGKAFASFQRSEMTWNGLRTNYMDRLYEITAPTLFINGEADSAVPVEYARRAHELVKDSRLYVMPGCKHWPQRDKTAEFNQAVREFLDE